MLKYIYKATWQHRTRTLLTISGSAVAMIVFCFVGSVQQGLQRLTQGQDSQRRLIVFQENRFCPTTSRLPEDYAKIIQLIPGVNAVMPIQVWTNNCRASLDIIVFNGAHPEQIKSYRPIELNQNRWSEFGSRPDAAIVGQKIAKRRGLRQGDQFTIGELSVHVADVFQSAVPSEENLIYTHLEFLQLANGIDAAGLVTQHEVVLNDNADPDQIAATIDDSLRSDTVATTTRRKGAFQANTLSDLVDLIGFAHWLGYACIGLVFSIVATTTVMNVQDRMKEYAVLQTIGVRPLTTMRLVLLESSFLCGLGGTIGVSVAIAALSTGGFAIGAEGATIAFEPSLKLATMGTFASFIIGMIAGIGPAIQAALVPIVKSLRQS